MFYGFKTRHYNTYLNTTRTSKCVVAGKKDGRPNHTPVTVTMAANPILKLEEGKKPIDFGVSLPLKAAACNNYTRPHFLCLHKL